MPVHVLRLFVEFGVGGAALAIEARSSLLVVSDVLRHCHRVTLVLLRCVQRSLLLIGRWKDAATLVVARDHLLLLGEQN